MRASPETPPPSDAKARSAAAPVRVYTGEGFPKFDAEFYRKARFGAQKIAEAIVPPREARAFRAGRPFLPHRQHRGPAGRRPQSLERARSLRALLQRQDARAPRHPCRHRRPAVEHAALSAADGDHHRTTRSAGTAGTRTAAASTTSSARAAIPTPTCLLNGGDYHHCCHSNLTRALADGRGRWRCARPSCMCTTCSTSSCARASPRDTHQYFMKASPVRPGDFIEFFAEIDLLGALSACPGGDCGSTPFERCGEMLPAQGRDLPPARGRARGLALAVAEWIFAQSRGVSGRGHSFQPRSKTVPESPFSKRFRRKFTRPSSARSPMSAAKAGVAPGSPLSIFAKASA